MTKPISELVRECIRRKTLDPLLQDSERIRYINDEIKLIMVDKNFDMKFIDKIELQSISTYLVSNGKQTIHGETYFYVYRNKNATVAKLLRDLKKIGFTFNKINEFRIIPDEKTLLFLKLKGIV